MFSISIHAELLIREWVKIGYNNVVVYAPAIGSTRYYSRSREKGWINEELILEDNYDVFIVEAYPGIPVRKLRDMLNNIILGR